MRKIENIQYSNLSNCQILTAYLPDDTVSSVFVYFHGGGLVEGDKSDADIFASYLTERKIALISANYRMYPDAEFPDFINDAALAVAWTKSHICNEYNCHKLYVGGSSAGGYLSMMLCYDAEYLKSVGLDNSQISGYFHDAGQPTAHFTVLNNSGYDPRRVIVDSTAPLYHVGMATEYPRTRFIVSDNDMACRYEQTMLILSTLSNFGHTNFDHRVMHGNHCEYCKKLDENGESVMGQLISDFISDSENEQCTVK